MPGAPGLSQSSQLKLVAALSLALARKYRPRSFAEVAVQSHVANTLRGAIARGRVAHGYLFAGPRGVGKTTLARVLAMALNCENRSESGEPCGSCASCARIWSGSSSLDVVEIDAASNRGVDDARELRERAMYAPTGDDRYKVYIVDEAHMLTREAWNALLKVLEEPPPRVVFVFATTEPHKIQQSAAPVLSRLQRFELKRIGSSDIVARLSHVLDAEGVEAGPEAIAMLARAADGSMRDALSLADQVISISGSVTPEAIRDALGLVPEDEFIVILDIIAAKRAAEVFPFMARLADAGVDFAVFLAGLADVLRAQLAIELGGEVPGMSPALREAQNARAGRLAAADLLRMLNAITALEPAFRKSGQQQLLVEMLLVRFALLDRAVSIEEMLQSLGGAASGAPARSEGGGSAPRAPERQRGSAPPERATPRASQPSAPADLAARPDADAPAAPAPLQGAPADVRPRADLERWVAEPPAERITAEVLRRERVEAIRQRSPFMDAAIDALDLELIE
ncbi:MAG TPA: DNA polymerase III subunit gamma/tau [Gemmatimonadaceae bacterium]